MASGDGYFLKALLSGQICAVISALLNGVDVTKIRMQNQSIDARIRNSQSIYSGFIKGMLKIYREEGITGLAKGVYPSMWREVTYSSIRFGGYEPIRNTLGRITRNHSAQSSTRDSLHITTKGRATAAAMPLDPHLSSPFIKYVSGLLAGGIGSAICNPLDVVKTRFQAVLPHETTPYGNNTAKALHGIYTVEGMSGLYRGWVVTSSRAAVLNSAQLGSYDSIKNNLFVGALGFSEGYSLHFFCAMTAAVITTTAVNPFDVIKTRYLTDNGSKYTSLLHCARQLLQSEGPAGFLKGWVPAYWRLGPHTVLSFMLMEQARKLLHLDSI